MTNNIIYEDLLNREPVQVSLGKALGYLKDKRVLVTGAGGSIGSELCRQIVSGKASRLYMLGHGENSIYEAKQDILKDLNRKMPENEIISVIGEIQDRDYMMFLMKRLKADVVFHTAAHKHVPMTEANPVEAIKNNVFGTKNMVDACKEANVEKFVLISTDKAVDPICIYGVSKHLAEEIVLKEEDHKFLVVRFGNVLGSKGSIIPLFVNQINRGGPVTITDERVTRFFMTIPEAVSLVLKTGGIGVGGELYLLSMGERVSIIALAERLMEYVGAKVEIEITGLRVGDKLHENLWSMKSESVSNTRYRGIIKVERLTKNKDLDILLERLKPVCFFDSDFLEKYRKRHELRTILKERFPTLRMLEHEPEY
jgi:FlaA1/EpsC-like NDP-sugar epimerase